MRRAAYTARLVLLLLVAGACRRDRGAAPPPAEPAAVATATADLVLKNGVIYTNDDRQPRVEALAVAGGRIVYVGSNRGVAPFEAGARRTLDLRGRTVVPGLTDAHVHLSGIGARAASLDLEGLDSLDRLLAAVKAEVARKPPGAWIQGRGWLETFWKPPVFPTRADLDRVAPQNPVFLTRADGHASVANGRALALAGVDRQSADPFGGRILRDRTGQPDGMLIDAAQDLVRRHLPAVTAAETERHLLLGAERELSLGWTQVHIAGNTWDEVALLRKLYREGKLKLRIYDAIRGPGPDAERLLTEGPSIGEFDGRLTVRAIKISIDGALGSRGAALLAPYADDPTTSGLLTQKEEVLGPLFERALRRGIQIETHAIGDRANRTVLDLYDRALVAVAEAQRAVAQPRWRIEHAQIVTLADIPRFAQLGVIPSMQPSHAIGDLHFAPRRLGLGTGRLDGAYAWRRFRDAGLVIAGGSDAPVERGEPMIELYAAVARRDLRGFRGEGWNPEQALTRAEALKAFTLWPAQASFEEGIRGSVEKGKLADLTVLSADVMQVPEAQIPSTRCLATIIGGELVYQAPEFPDALTPALVR